MILLVPTPMEVEYLLGGSARERLESSQIATVEFAGRKIAAAICGMGFPAAFQETASILKRFLDTQPEDIPPKRALLAGIAGTYDVERAQLGSALLGTVARLSIVGEIPETTSAPDSISILKRPGRPARLAVPDVAGEPVMEGEIVTVLHPSESRAEAQRIRERYPDALAEEMEAYFAASAAATLGMELTVVRGISNVVGVMDKNEWGIPEALDAARNLLERVVKHYVSEGSS
jgi:nucleoside phosphorylase